MKKVKGGKDRIAKLKREIEIAQREEEEETRREEIKRRDTEARGRGKSNDNIPSKKVLEKARVSLTRVEKALLRKQIIGDRLKEYIKPIKLPDGKEYKPTERNIQEYEVILSKIKFQNLKLMGSVIKAPLKLELMDRIKSYNRKEHAVVTIFNDNQTTDTGVIHCYDRTFSRHDMTYMVMSERGRYDPEFKMMHFYYYANRPCPIKFSKGKDPEGVYDARLIDDTIQMKVIEALAAVDIEKFIKITLICVILSLLMSIIIILILSNMSGLINIAGK